MFPSPAAFEDVALQTALLRFVGFATPRLRPGYTYNCVASCPPRAPDVAARVATVTQQREGLARADTSLSEGDWDDAQAGG